MLFFDYLCGMIYNMKILVCVFVVLLLTLTGCNTGRAGKGVELCRTDSNEEVLQCDSPVYHTCFGDINTDSLEVGLWDADGSPCYVVRTAALDSIEKAPGVWGCIHGPVVYYYNPRKDVYYLQFPTNDEHGNAIINYNPDK